MADVDLCTLDDVKDAVAFNAATGSDNELISDLITAASRRIMRASRREFRPAVADETRRFRVDQTIVDLAPYDLRAVTTVTLHPDSDAPVVLVADEDFALRPIGGSEGMGTYTRLRLARSLAIGSDYAARFGHALVDVRGAWGAWASVADVHPDVRRACVETVLAWLDRAAAQYALTGEDGRAVLPTAAASWDIPTSAWRKLGAFERIVVV